MRFYIFSGSAQNLYNPELKKQLDSVWQLDQKYREVLSNGIPDSLKKDSMAKSLNISPGNLVNTLWRLQNAIDSSNLIFVEKILFKYGYPGKTMVGPGTCEAAWNIIQHSPKIDQHLGLIKRAATKKELPFKLYAMMFDRYLVNLKREQIYGSQVVLIRFKNGQRGWFVWPVRNPKKVNKLRRGAGFDQTVEENAKRLDVDYSVIKISDLQL